MMVDPVKEAFLKAVRKSLSNRNDYREEFKEDQKFNIFLNAARSIVEQHEDGLLTETEALWRLVDLGERCLAFLSERKISPQESSNKIRKHSLKEFGEDSYEALYKKYAEYIKNELKKKRPNLPSFHEWRMQEDDDYRDEALNRENEENWTDPTNQDEFDSRLDMYRIAGIDG